MNCCAQVLGLEGPTQQNMQTASNVTATRVAVKAVRLRTEIPEIFTAQAAMFKDYQKY